LRIAVCAKQVADPDVPPSQFRVDEVAKRAVPPQGVAPVVNGFDLNATEAALRLRDAALREPSESLRAQPLGAGARAVEITVFSAGTGFVMDVMKKPLSMGADRLVLVDDPVFAAAGAAATARTLAAAIRRDGQFDLILCGRQASDWDQALVPFGIAEALGLPCVTLARSVAVKDGVARIERVLPGIVQTVEAPLPLVVTVSNELGEPRYPTLRGIMAAGRKQPLIVKLADLGMTAPDLSAQMMLRRLSVPERRRAIELVEGKDDAESGRMLALRLRHEKLI
jgi:electron transfer flavoprotein beta subunit